MSVKTLISWSSGKDSAWMLYTLQQQDDVEIAGLLTTFNTEFNRVAMHAVRHNLVVAQAKATTLPLFEVPLPWPCTNDKYEEAMRKALFELYEEHAITHIAFGDLFLEDIRQYREEFLKTTSLQSLFPIWGQATDQLANTMIDSGLEAKITCVDPKKLDATFAGRQFDHNFLNDLPDDIDPCGEWGEFHTFAHSGPMFKYAVQVNLGEVVERDGFVFADLKAA